MLEIKILFDHDEDDTINHEEYGPSDHDDDDRYEYNPIDLDDDDPLDHDEDDHARD